MDLDLKEIEKIVDEATEDIRAWVYQDEQKILTALNKQIKHKLKEINDKTHK